MCLHSLGTQAERMVPRGGKCYKRDRQGTAMDKGTGKADRGSFVHGFAGHQRVWVVILQTEGVTGRVSLSVAMAGSSLYFILQ